MARATPRLFLRLIGMGLAAVAAQPVWAQGPGRAVDVGTAIRPGARPPMVPAGREEIVIRISRVTGSQLTAGEMARLSREVDRVWAPHGVRVDWTDGTPLGESGQAAHLVLVMLGSFECPADVPRGGLAALHTAPINTAGTRDDRAAAVIMVSLDRAWRLANRAFGNEQTVAGRTTWVRARLPVLIGRAVAHEIGHYLLESREHTKHGLMRAAYGLDDVKYALDDRLDAAQIARIRLLGAQRENARALASSR